MKVDIKNDKIIVFLNKKDNIKTLIDDEEKLEDYFKTIFLKLNKKYDIDINGYYNVDIYLDNNYGAILEIKEEDLDYYNYFSQIDMKLNVSKITSFLYEIKYEFLDDELLKKLTCYKYLDRLFIKLDDNVDILTLSTLLEFSKIIYGNETERILKYGKKVKL